jgi:ribosomal protein S8
MKLTQIQLLLKLKNLSIRNIEKVSIAYNKKSITLIDFLYKEKFIQSFFVIKNTICLFLRSHNRGPLLKNLKVISKPSFQKFITYKEICKLKINNKTLVAVSTDSSIQSLVDCKMKTKKGGKILFIS